MAERKAGVMWPEAGSPLELRGAIVRRCPTVDRALSVGQPEGGTPDLSAQGEIVATKTKTAFRQECTVSAVISAPADRIWSLLTDTSHMVGWNSTLTSIEGNVELGGT